MFRFADQLAKAARTWPDSPAVSCAAGTLSWSELADRCAKLAHSLHARGVMQQDRVGYLGFNGRMGVESFYASSLIGAAVVPLNYRLSDEELITTLNDCRPRVIVVDSAHAQSLARCLPSCPSVEHVLCQDDTRTGWLSYEAELAADHPGQDARPGGGEDMLVMFYTGGTTGRPKGVALSHSNIFSNAMGILACWDMFETESYAVTGPLFHSAAGARIFGAALMGTHLVLQPKFDIPDLLANIETHKIAIAQFVPTMIAMLLDHPDFELFDTSSLRLITYGGAPMQPELLKRAMAAFPGVRFGQAFGMTEASPIVTFLNPEDHDDPSSRRLHSIGRPAPFVDLVIVDEDDTPLPDRQVGEIALRGPNIMLGYWEQPEQTASAMRGGWYHTGDAGYRDTDGYIYLSGRIKDMIITGGENVYPIEVENVLAQHPAVAQAAVIGLPDPTWGERVHAVITTGADGVGQAELIAHCRAHLAHYKCPKTISVSTDPLPLTKVNKIDKLALRQRYTKESPDNA